jgi:hypothetical protein
LPLVNTATATAAEIADTLMDTVSNDVKNFVFGKVFEDFNGDGVFNGSDMGFMATDIIRVFRDENNDNMVDAGDTFLGTASTDANGDYIYLVDDQGDAAATVYSGNLVVTVDRTRLPGYQAGSPEVFLNFLTGAENHEADFVGANPHNMRDENNDFGFASGVCKAFPTFEGAPADGRFISVAGEALDTMVNEPLHFFFAVEAAQSSFQVGIYDGDCGKAPGADTLDWLNGHWDYRGTQGNTLDGSVRYRLFADPDKDFSTMQPADGDLVATWFSDQPNIPSGGDVWTAPAPGMPDNGWWDVMVPTEARAMAPSGNFFYRLVVDFENPTPNDLWCNFKLRTTGTSISAAEGRVMAFAGVLVTGQDYSALYPTGFPPAVPVYDGTWTFTYEEAVAPVEVAVWNGDFDAGSTLSGTLDTDDLNTAATARPPVALSGTEVDEGAQGLGNPPDDIDAPEWGVGGPIRLSVEVPIDTMMPPTTTTFLDDNPSGDSEWERFVVTNNALDPDNEDPANYAAAPFVASMQAGFYKTRVIGLDLTNLTYLYFEREAFACDPDGEITVLSRPFEPLRKHPSSISGRVGRDLNRDGALSANEPAASGAMVYLRGTDREGETVFLETAVDPTTGRYQFSNLVPGYYEVFPSVFPGRAHHMVGSPGQGKPQGVALLFDDAREEINFAVRYWSPNDIVGPPVQEDELSAESKEPAPRLPSINADTNQ